MVTFFQRIQSKKKEKRKMTVEKPDKHCLSQVNQVNRNTFRYTGNIPVKRNIKDKFQMRNIQQII